MNFKGTVLQFAEQHKIVGAQAQTILSYMITKGWARVIGEAPKKDKQKGRAAKIYEAVELIPVTNFDPSIQTFIPKVKDEENAPNPPTAPTMSVEDRLADRCDDAVDNSDFVVPSMKATSLAHSEEAETRRQQAALIRQSMADDCKKRLDAACPPKETPKETPTLVLSGVMVPVTPDEDANPDPTPAPVVS